MSENKINIDNKNKDDYNMNGMDIINNLKKFSILLAKINNQNIKLEIDINPKLNSAKIKKTEFDI
jgi:hypothetical protein